MYFLTIIMIVFLAMTWEIQYRKQLSKGTNVGSNTYVIDFIEEEIINKL